MTPGDIFQIECKLIANTLVQKNYSLHVCKEVRPFNLKTRIRLVEKWQFFWRRLVFSLYFANHLSLEKSVTLKIALSWVSLKLYTNGCGKSGENKKSL